MSGSEFLQPVEIISSEMQKFAAAHVCTPLTLFVLFYPYLITVII